MSEKIHKEKEELTKDIKLAAIGAGAGVCAAAVAVAYRFALSYGERIREIIYGLGKNPVSTAFMFVILLLLGFVTGKITESEPMIKGSGIPQLEGELHGYFDMNWLPVLIKKFFGGALCAMGGLSLGREGPSIQLGAVTAKGLAKKLKVAEEDMRYIIVCGACAGLSAAFNAPFAGAVFAIEEVHKKVSRRTVMPAIAAACIADVISKLFFSTQPTLTFSMPDALPMKYYIACVGVGVLTGVMACIYNATLLGTQKVYSKIKAPLWLKIMIPFAVAGVLGLVMPEVLGSGHHIFEELAEGKLVLSAMLLLLVVKFAFSMVSFASGAPGGIFFPLLVLGALGGSIFFAIANLPEEYMILFVVFGMVGMFSGIVRAPLTGVVLVLEMTGAVNQLICLAIVAGAAMITAEALGSKPIYDSLLENMIKK